MSASDPATASSPSTRSRHATTRLRDVFVIGAGASVPYGMPTGADLLARMRRIPTVVPPDEPILKEVMGRDKPSTPLSESRARRFHLEWVKQIKGSVILSVDQFLRNRTDDSLRLYGKALMARELLACENSSLRGSRNAMNQNTVGHPDPHLFSTDWIQVLLSQVDLLKNAEEYLLSTAFLSFNYDRILEFFLRQFLIVERGKTLSEADDFIARMTIIHLNGFLGTLSQLPFGNLGKNETMPWVPLEDGVPKLLEDPSYREITMRLRTVWDAEAHVQGDTAKASVANAERIFILGTSFIPENLEAIGLGPHPSQGRELRSHREDLFATSLGLSRSQVARAGRLLGVDIRTKPPYEENRSFREVTCVDLVTDELVL